VDYPADPGCASAASTTESPQCNDGADNDSDTLVDLADPQCVSASHDLEGPPPPACSNGIDDDGDGLVDYAADPGCFDYASLSEVTACQDGVDNDGMPGIDFDGGASVNGGVPLSTADPQCTSATLNSEATIRQGGGGGCGLGPELALLIPALLALRHRRRES
jgi:hypothetical protein